jgi:hypothetical protein
VCRSKHVEPLINFGIINSITKLHLVGISTESSTIHGSMNMPHTLIIWSVLNDKPFLKYELSACTIYFQFISIINLYIFRAGLLLIRRYCFVYTTIGMRDAFMLTGCWQDPANSQSAIPVAVCTE